MKIAALISVYEEDDLLDSCIESAEYLDIIMVFDGPTTTNETTFTYLGRKLTSGNVAYHLYQGTWKSDAEKRTEMLREAKIWEPDAWGLWLDGDEILLYGQYLKDHARRAAKETGAGGFTLRIVEYDGSVAQCHGKVIKLDAIKRYVMSSYEVELQSGFSVSLPNVPICSAGGIPLGEISERTDERLASNRPPLIGEPHLLHRHGLRSPERSAPRLHDKESESFEGLVNQHFGKDIDLG